MAGHIAASYLYGVHSSSPVFALKRYAAFDPPEYQTWESDPQLIRDYHDRIEGDTERASVVAQLSREALLEIYRDLLVTRLQDIGLKRWVRLGVISKAWLGMGEEAVTVGVVSALDRGRDVVSPMIRNSGACHMMGMPLEDGFKGYLATADSPSGGRDLHIGSLRRGVIPPISHMGTSVTIVAGAALAFKNRDEARVAVTWVGDGATKTAACHEGLVVAARLGVPAIFVVQNNQVALGTRVDQHGAGNLIDLPAAYGMESLSCDGNHVLDVFAAATLARNQCIEGRGPVALVAETFRMGGHATHDEREARETFSPELFEHWGRRDPIGLFESYLMDQGVAREILDGIEAEATEAVESAAERARAAKDELPQPTDALYGGFSEGGVLHAIAHRMA